MYTAITKEDVRRAMNNLGVPNENEARGMVLCGRDGREMGTLMG